MFLREKVNYYVSRYQKYDKFRLINENFEKINVYNSLQ